MPPRTSQIARLHGLQRFGPIVPLLAVLSTLPYTLVYLANLWQQPHYQFFPLLLVGIGLLAQKRWGDFYPQGGWLLKASRWTFLAAGLFGAFCATLFASPWMGYFAFAACFTSWLGYRRDNETGSSLLYLALPLWLIWQPPYNTIITADTVLIQKLQSVSAQLSSQWLDMLAYPHHQPGTILEFSGRSFGVAEACSGIQSFFAVLCFGAMLVSFLRRPLVHSMLLLATCPGWALLMNTIRITAIPLAYALLDIDLSHGFLHDLLGYCTMGLAIALMLSTDELLLKLREFLPAPAPINTGRDQSDTKSSPTEYALEAKTLVAGIPIFLALLFFFAIQSYDAYQSWGVQRHVIDFFRDEPLIEMAASDAPTELLGWRQKKYEQENRARGNDDMGQRSDLWFYESPVGEMSLSFDQAFPGWHELTRCYRNAGWTPLRRAVLDGPNVHNWPVVTVELVRGNEHGFLIYALVNRSGQPLTPPDDYNYWTILQERLRGRLTPAVRGALFGVAAYQTQIFITGYAEIPAVVQQAAIERFLFVRPILWQAARTRIESADM